MMSKLILSALSCICIIACVSCKTETTENSETVVKKKDTIPVTNLNATSSPITPPDADYTGDYVDKYPNGIIKFTGFFRFGQRHGQWLAFYDNGIKWSECTYDKGKKDGESIVYFPNGNMQYKGWYKNDLQDSIWIYYDINKQEIDRRAFKNGEQTGLVN
jgi:antitoxin component YwqK of YwqJK toxin-antitoxin module